MENKSPNQKQVFTKEEVEKSTLEYFKNDKVATKLWVEKYCLQNKSTEEFYELNPDETHRRFAKELFKIEEKYPEAMSEDEIYHLLKSYEYLVVHSNNYPKGNNPCFTGDTLVSVADGRGYVSFKQLVEEGKNVEVYSESENKVVTIKTMRNPRVTETNQKIYKITFSSGEFIRATKNHKFYLIDNQKVELCNLKKGQKLRSISRYKNTRGSGIMNRDSKLYGDLPSFTIQSIKEDGVEDVYNGTVDQYHNYFVGNFKGKVGREIRLGSSIKVANCGEGSQPNFSLNLSINLYGYITNKFLPLNLSVFEDEMFIKHVKSAVRLADNIVDLKINEIDKKLLSLTDLKNKNYWEGIKKELVEKRKTRLSLTGLSDMMAALGIKNGTKESILFTEKLFQLFSTTVYEGSIELASERGHFPLWDKWDVRSSDFLGDMFDLKGNELMTTEIQEQLSTFGRRNVSLISAVRNKDVSILTQNSLGVSPVEKIFRNTNSEIHKPFIDFYSGVTGISFELSKEILNGLKKEELSQIFEKSPYYKSLEKDIPNKSKLGMVKGIKKWSDSSSENFYNKK